MSSMSKVPSSKNMTNESSEESGWTMYFEDFFNKQNTNDQKCSMTFSGVDHDSSSSLVSDAASLAPTKTLVNSAQAEECRNRLSFKKKKKKTKTSLVDDSLEDTASSPITSPKENGNTSGERDERKELPGFNERDSECTELKNKGLCLVPLSMIVNYLG
ncbi:vascular-related unknown protein 4 [Gastrolobium bilobum]|uniref:vascular-related unknown protein 4 n=1 Tax=Gastrolobium bilobum TaxID=150636 RepID=UPI002AB11C6B|nr:vascular-related unknown protein 4 [Gastrolobium bilobum]